MSFAVSVPVLSVQMTVALPIVSHAPRYRTRLFSANIRRTENANASVVASGRPSGTATTTTVTPRTKKRRYSFASDATSEANALAPPPTYQGYSRDHANSAERTTKVSAPATNPNRPTVSASASSFFCSGVRSSRPRDRSGELDASAATRPDRERSPTATTRHSHRPSSTFEPDARKKSGLFFGTPPAGASPFGTSSGSPVRWLSSTMISSPGATRVTIASAGATSPASTRTRSPTRTSRDVTVASRPLLTTLASRLDSATSATRSNLARFCDSFAAVTVATKNTAPRMAAPSTHPGVAAGSTTSGG